MNSNKSFEEWIEHIFGRPITDPPWFQIDAEGDWEPPETLAVEFLIRTFENPRVLSMYSDAQINLGLSYLASGSSSNYMHAILQSDSQLQSRAVRSVYILFSVIFSEKCSPKLSSINEKYSNPLNSSCYMWWDTFPWHGKPNDAKFVFLDDAILSVLGQILDLGNDACRESALHGLGHWASAYPDRVKSIISGFLAKTPGLRPELRLYAENAMRGDVN